MRLLLSKDLKKLHVVIYTMYYDIRDRLDSHYWMIVKVPLGLSSECIGNKITIHIIGSRKGVKRH